MPSSRKLSISKFRFGIELELGIDFDKLNDRVELPDGWNSHEEHCGSEIVSPILVGRNGIFQIRECLRSIWDAFKSIVFDDCGMHVHVDIQDFTLGNIKNLLRLGTRFDEIIYSIMDPSRYENTYCHHLDYDDSAIDSCRTIQHLYDLQDGERYYGINIMAFGKHGTVEFRYARGTADWAVIYSLVSMYLRMVQYSRLNLTIPNIDIHKWTSAGLRFNKEKRKSLQSTKELFFDILEIRGGVRAILNEMFEENCNHNKETPSFETRKQFSQRKIKFQTGLRFTE